MYGSHLNLRVEVVVVIIIIIICDPGPQIQS